MIKRMIIMLSLCALVFGGLFGYKMFVKKMMMEHMASMGDTAQTVSTIQASKTPWQDNLKAVGSLRAAKGADIAPEIAGTVKNIFMESGQDVMEGTVLAQLDSAEDYAKLQSLIATLRHAEITVERDKKQIAVQAISQATYDADIATLENLKAQVEEQKAVLDKKTITAPFSGRLGIRQIDVGQYITAGTVIANLQQLDPVFFDFSVPQQDLPFLKEGQKVVMTTDAIPGKTFEGTITALEAKIDESTRNIAVRASFENPDKLLRPGMYATATITIGEPKDLITLPQTAITYNPYGSNVYVVNETTSEKTGEKELRVEMVFVKTGKTRGDQVAILDGVKEGDVIVTAGQLKLRNGTKVVVNNKVVPSDEASPATTDY